MVIVPFLPPVRTEAVHPRGPSLAACLSDAYNSAFVLNRRINVESVMFRFLFPPIESLRFLSGLFVKTRQKPEHFRRELPAASRNAPVARGRLSLAWRCTTMCRAEAAWMTLGEDGVVALSYAGH